MLHFLILISKFQILFVNITVQRLSDIIVFVDLLGL